VSATGSAEIPLPRSRSGLHILRAEGGGRVLSQPLVF
jgi:hypothetical protein